ncbi:hypothetical protein RUM44_004449 [Polyplax serrata]|uniref:Uncharacterized protein n=1 Tax=Polyplax serrata TaxID=468196 RepID=A0ABR1B2X5_POLSC
MVATKTVASKNTATVLTKSDKELKLDNLDLEKGKSKRPVQNGSVSALPPSSVKGNDGKPKPPVPPKRSTLTYGKSYVSVADSNAQGTNPVFSPTLSKTPSKEFQEGTCSGQVSQVVTVTTNLLSTTPKGLPTPKLKSQRVLSTFLPVLPPKNCKSPLIQSPNFPRTTEPDVRRGTEEVNSESQHPERRVSEKDSPSPSSISSSKTQSSSASNSLDKDIPRDDTFFVKSSTENTPNKTSQEKPFTPSQSPPPLQESPPKPPRKDAKDGSVKKAPAESSPPSLESSPLPIRKSPSLNQTSDTPKVRSDGRETKDDLELNRSSKSKESIHENNALLTLYLEDSNEKTNTIKRAPSSDQKHADANKERESDGAVKLRPKSPIRVSFANDDEETNSKIYEKISRTKRATKELKNIIHQIQYSECDYCSDDNCRTCVVQKTSSLSRRRSTSPKTAFARSADLVEGYTSCCEEGTKVLAKKTKNLTRKIGDRKITYDRSLCNCPFDNLVISNRVPLSRPNSSIGDYCTQPSRSKSAVRAKKNSGAGIKTPFLTATSKVDFDRPGLGLIVTISSDGIDKEPKRTVQFISGGPAINFGLGGTLGRYTKCKSQDKSLKISGNTFHSDHSPGELEGIAEWAKYSSKLKVDRGAEGKKSHIKEETTQEILNAQIKNDNNVIPSPVLERQKSVGELKRPRSSRAADEYRQRYLNVNKSPGEVLEHFGKLATSVTTSDISKISNENKTSENTAGGHVKSFDVKGAKTGNQNHGYENYRTVPPASFNNPNPYLGSAFVQYVRETLPYQPNSFPGGITGSAFNKYIRPGSGRFDKSLIFPQQPKSDKPSAFERLCGDKIYASRRGIYGKTQQQNQNVSGSLDCVWGVPKPKEPPKPGKTETETPAREIRPASCTYEINKGRTPGVPPSSTGPYSNYSVVVNVCNKDKSSTPDFSRTSKNCQIETEAPTAQTKGRNSSTKVPSAQGVKTYPPQYFNARNLENYKLAPGFKTDLSTLYSGVFYTNPKQDGVSSRLSHSSRILYEYGIKSLGTSYRGSKEETSTEGLGDPMGSSASTERAGSSEAASARKVGSGGGLSMPTSSAIPEEAPLGVTLIYPPQYHPTVEEFAQGNQQVTIPRT